MVQASVTARVARGWSCCWHECDWRGCAQGWKTCMLGAGPPRDGIIRTSPGQECSKDKGALPGARRISVYAARFRSATGCKTRVCFKPYHLILHLGEKRVSLCSAKRQSARSSMDRASDYGSEGWGFESLRARSGPPRCDPPVGVLHLWKALLRECFFHARRGADEARRVQTSPTPHASTRLTRSAASPPTARSTRNAAPQSPGPPRYLRRNAPRARQEMPR